ncbi:MAG: N-acetyltransferase family protein [bacterium]|nr:N-acetyltransferase family protein [bacterium]
MKIRNVSPADAARIADIYSHYISDTIVTFEIDPVSPEEIGRRIREIMKDYPYLAAEDESGTVIGYAYASRFREREAYRHTAEVTIYLDKDRTGAGIGSPLFAELLNRLRKTDTVALIGAVALPNEPSVRLHEKFGFRKVAHLEKVGFKLGKWIDVGYWELLIRKTG